MTIPSQPTYLTLGNDTREIVDTVVRQVREAVVSTMGPNGKLALIKSGVSTKTTKDGVTVARSIKYMDDRFELINRVITEPAIKTDAECGDGTTTTILLTAALYETFKQFPNFADQRMIERVVQNIIGELTAMAIKVEVTDPRLYMMALTSSNQDAELAQTVVDLYVSAQAGGRYPEIELRENNGSEDKIERIEGRVLRMHYSSPAFGKNGSGGELILDGYSAVVIDDRLSNLDPGKFVDALEDSLKKVAGESPTPLLIIARGIEQDVMSMILNYSNHPNNKWMSKGGLPPIIAMNTGLGGSIGTSQMQDLAVMLGAPMLTSFYDLPSVDLGYKHATVKLGSTRSSLTDLQPHDLERIEEQAKSIEKDISEYSLTERFSRRARFNEDRLRALRGEMVTIHVGGETNSEVKERKDRYEDVVKAVKSGLVNGILPGAGVALIRATVKVLNALTTSDHHSSEIITAIHKAMIEQHCHLMEGVLDKGQIALVRTGETDKYPVINLATNQIGLPEDIGVFDTAFAAITALKGGLQTAKILANTQSLLLGDKVHAVNVPI